MAHTAVRFDFQQRFDELWVVRPRAVYEKSLANAGYRAVPVADWLPPSRGPWTPSLVQRFDELFCTWFCTVFEFNALGMVSF